MYNKIAPCYQNLVNQWCLLGQHYHQKTCPGSSPRDQSDASRTSKEQGKANLSVNITCVVIRGFTYIHTHLPTHLPRVPCSRCPQDSSLLIQCSGVKTSRSLLEFAFERGQTYGSLKHTNSALNQPTPISHHYLIYLSKLLIQDGFSSTYSCSGGSGFTSHHEQRTLYNKAEVLKKKISHCKLKFLDLFKKKYSVEQ